MSKALAEVLVRTREQLEANERAEVARHVRLLLKRSGLAPQEFASRIGVHPDGLRRVPRRPTSPSASLMIRMRRLSDRFAKMARPQQQGGKADPRRRRRVLRARAGRGR